MRFSIYQESKKGGRKVNQDRMGYLYTRDSLLMLLCDGMGGHARGEVAAQITLQTMASIYQRDAKPLLPDPVRYLQEAALPRTGSCIAIARSTACPRRRVPPWWPA
jgi:protein phosphatase